MVKIVLQKDQQGRWLSMACSGHAEFSDEEYGGDIVCAAISALTGYLGITVAEVLAWPGSVRARDGEFHFLRPQEGPPESFLALDVILDGLERSLRGLEENYSGWVKIEQSSL